MSRRSRFESSDEERPLDSPEFVPTRVVEDNDGVVVTETGEVVPAPSADSISETIVDVYPEGAKCEACNGIGAVPENVVNGRVDKWKECPNCLRCPSKCDNGKVANSVADCPLCYRGRITREALARITPVPEPPPL